MPSLRELVPSRAGATRQPPAAGSQAARTAGGCAAGRPGPGARQVAWLTPSELFTPFYGRAVASFLLAEHARGAAGGAPLHVFEVPPPPGAEPHMTCI